MTFSTIYVTTKITFCGEDPHHVTKLKDFAMQFHYEILVNDIIVFPARSENSKTHEM